MSKFNPKALSHAINEYEEIYGNDKSQQYQAVKPTKNYHADLVYQVTPELDLYNRACNMSIFNSYYNSENNMMKELKSLVEYLDPQYVAKLAVYARESMYMRTLPIVLAIELAKSKKGSKWVSKVLDRVVKRPDEITEALAYYQHTNNRTETKKLGKVSNQVLKGIRQVFESGRFDEYQFAKYNRQTEVKLRDALFLSHPKPRDNKQKELFAKIATNSLETPYTWETQLSEAGKNGESKSKVWESLIDSGRVGYMALLRNLRNILICGVSDDHILKVCKILSDEQQVLRSKQLPFRYLSAYRSLIVSERCYWRDSESKNVDHHLISKVIDALDDAVQVSVRNFPDFGDKRALIVSDVSGSMISPISPKSSVMSFDIGIMMCAMASMSFDTSVTGIFGDTFKTVNFGKKSVFQGIEEMYKREGEVGYSTNGYKVLKYALNKKLSFDKIMIFTDCQMYNSNSSWGEPRSFQSYWDSYKNVNPNCKLYLFNLNGYNTVPLEMKNDDVHLISGWSDKIFEVMSNIEKGENALDKIKAIEL